MTKLKTGVTTTEQRGRILVESPHFPEAKDEPINTTLAIVLTVINIIMILWAI